MEERSESRRLPGGERCSQCGDRKYYIENGMRFCAANGHEIEGFVQFDVGEEEDSGRMGTVARREKEVREREKRQLTGLAGKSLYLEALQFTLRQQLLWLIHEKGHREELETVVRDLWDLRIRGFGALQPEMNAEGGLELFSSQPTPEEPEIVAQVSSASQDWSLDSGNWPLPKIIDTLALCYLGCLLLRTSTTVGEFSGWANGHSILYRRAYYELPKEMQDRMPSHYTQAMKMPLFNPFQGDELQEAVFNLAAAYHLNYKVVFPELEPTTVLAHLTRHLALPIESLLTAQILSSLLDCRFQFSLHKSRLLPTDYPENLVASLLVVATKLCFPFKSAGIVDQKLNWETWATIKRPEAPESRQRIHLQSRFKDMTADEVAILNDEDLELYFNYMSTLTENKNQQPVTKFFPSIQPPPPIPPTPEITEDEVTEWLKSMMSTAFETSPPLERGGETMTQVTRVYEAFRTSDDLSPVARKLYQATAELAGMRLETLVRAVYTLEQRIQLWQRGRSKSFGRMADGGGI